MTDKRPILIASHPRSGTHLMLDLMRRQFPDTRSWRLWGKPLDHLYLNIERTTSDHRHFGKALTARVLERPRRALIKTHYLADFSASWVEEETGPLPAPVKEAVKNASKIYVHRDPRDVMVSYMQFLSGFRPDIAAMDLMGFMKAPHWAGRTDMLGWWVEHVRSWQDMDGVLMVSYRDLIKAPQATVKMIATHTDCKPLMQTPILPPKVTSISRTRADRLLKLAPSSTAIIADKDKFPPYDWKKTMTNSDHEWLESRAKSIMTTLGYPSFALEN